jgi:MFS family permease
MNRLLSHLGPPLRAVHAVIGNPSIRRMQLAFLLFNVAEPAMWIGLLLWAFDRGGTQAVGLITILCLVPTGILAPVAAALGDRFPRAKVVRGGYAAQGVLTAIVAVAVAMDLPTWAVAVLALLASLPYATGRPGHHALMPALASRPEEVAATNSVSAIVEGIGYIVGGLAAAALGTIGAGAIVAMAAGALALAVLLTLGVRTDEPSTATEGLRPWSLVRDAVTGLRDLVGSAGPRALVILYGALAVTSGAIGVLIVPLAIDRLGLGDPGVGLLSTTQSVGLFLGATLSIGFATRRRLAFGLVAAAAVYAGGAALLGVGAATVVAIVGTLGYGAGMTLIDVLARTMLQRTTDEDLLTRAFGTVEGLWLLGYAIGAALAAPVASATGLSAAFAVLGGIFLASGLLVLPALRRIDAAAVIPVRQLSLLEAIPFFAPLPRVDLELIAGQLDREVAPAGTEVIRQGEVGDRFYVVDAGRFEVEVDGRRIASVDEGDFFGEIALLHDVPRTATVRAVEDGAVWVLEREEFLVAVTGLPPAHAAAHEVSARRLRTHPT